MEPTADHGDRRLTVEQKDIVVGVVQTFSINNLPLSKLQIREMVSRRGALDESESRMRRFLRRHYPHLRARSCKALVGKRVGAQINENVKGFLTELTGFVSTHHVTSATVMNFDETRVVVKSGSLTTKRVIHALKKRSNASSTRTSTVVSPDVLVVLRASPAPGSRWGDVERGELAPRPGDRRDDGWHDARVGRGPGTTGPSPDAWPSQQRGAPGRAPRRQAACVAAPCWRRGCAGASWATDRRPGATRGLQHATHKAIIPLRLVPIASEDLICMEELSALVGGRPG